MLLISCSYLCYFVKPSSFYLLFTSLSRIITNIFFLSFNWYVLGTWQDFIVQECYHLKEWMAQKTDANAQKLYVNFESYLNLQQPFRLLQKTPVCSRTSLQSYSLLDGGKPYSNFLGLILQEVSHQVTFNNLLNPPSKF